MLSCSPKCCAVDYAFFECIGGYWCCESFWYSSIFYPTVMCYRLAISIVFNAMKCCSQSRVLQRGRHICSNFRIPTFLLEEGTSAIASNAHWIQWKVDDAVAFGKELVKMKQMRGAALHLPSSETRPKHAGLTNNEVVTVK